ncbi:MAG: glycine zipper 2TM domain-containing protein [Pirellulaceae bacterium]|nr:glycine zipper 2TM domain-containing protein [Pirellulaceae bacterium]
MTRKWLAGLAMLLVSGGSSLAQEGTRNGAVLGGVSGAVIGGIIGHQNDEVPEGALIGGAVGAIAGGLIGNAREQQVRQRYYQPQPQRWAPAPQPHQHTYNTYRTVPSRTTTTVVAAPGVTIADVLSMTRNGVGESVIINHIYSNGLQRRISTNEIISLHQQGVTENIINAMQQAPLRNAFTGSPTISGPSSTTIMTPPGGTVIVQEQYGTPTYTPPTTYVQPSYARPSYYPSYPQRRGF